MHLRPFSYAIFNSKQISSNKHFSKMPLNARNWLWIHLLIPPSFHVCFPTNIIGSTILRIKPISKFRRGRLAYIIGQVGKNKQICLHLYIYIIESCKPHPDLLNLKKLQARFVVPTYEKTPRNLKNNSHATFLTQKNKNKSDIGNLSVTWIIQ